MKKLSYGERDYAFGQTMLTLRTTIGLTQERLAELLGVSRRAVGDWEAGTSYPKTEHFKQFIALASQQQAFPAGREAEEIRAFWKAAHQKVLLDEQWLSSLLNQQRLPQHQIASQIVEDHQSAPPVSVPSPGELRVDWGDALAVPTFYGRNQELATLAQWVLQERCRLVCVLGMGGIGKSALTVHAMYHMAEHFQVVIFRSLRNAPSCETLLDECLQVLAPQPLSLMPADLERRISLLLEHMRASRVMLVLDNLESLLEEGETRVQLRPDMQGYAQLLRRVAETAHQSCLLLTSREKPTMLRALESSRQPVRSLRLAGLEAPACELLLAEHEVVGSPDEQARLVEGYMGNPLALNIVAETITDLFSGEIGPFLAQGSIVFGQITTLLDEQYSRLSTLEQTILSWLAILREPVTLEELRAVLVTPPSPGEILEAVDGLRQRSLIERGQRLGSVTLQSVVLEYVTAHLIEEVASEIQQGQPYRLIQHGFSLAHAKEYVRQTQERLLIGPLLMHLQSISRGRAELEILTLLNQIRLLATEAQGYGPANLIALLRLLHGHLRGLDLSRLAIRDASLQGVELQDATLAGSILDETVFTESLGAIWAVAVSRTGRLWAAGSWQGEARVWCEGGQRLHLVWQAHTDTLFTLAFSPDERTLATGSWDGTVKLWDVQSGALLWTNRHADIVLSVAFSPDGNRLASSGNDGIIYLWDLPSGMPLQTLECQRRAVYAVAWSPNDHLLASGCDDGTIQLWQVGSDPATCTRTLIGHSHWVYSLAFAPDGTQLASGSWDSTVKVWDVSRGCVLQTLRGHTQRVYSVAWSSDGGTLASASFDRTIWLWDVALQRYRAALHGHNGPVYQLAFISESNRLLSGSEDSTIRVWDVDRGQCLRILQGYAVSVYDLDWSPDGMYLVSGSTDGLVIVWGGSEKMSPRVVGKHHWIVQGVGWSPDGRKLASCGWDHTIRVWQPTTGACLQEFRDPGHRETLFHCVAWSSDGQRLASGCYLYGVHMWDVPTHHLQWVGQTQPTAFRCVAWSPDGTRLVSGSDDGKVCLWDPATGTLQRQLLGHRGMVASVAWSSDGMRLASAGGGRNGGELLVWDIHSEKPVQSFAGLPNLIFTVTWDLSGNLLISGDSDGMLRWWDVAIGKEVMRCEAHQGIVRSLKRSPDGQQLASCGEDGTIMLWDLRSGKHLHTLRRDRPYERLDITDIKGLTEAQKATLHDLGAIETIL